MQSKSVRVISVSTQYIKAAILLFLATILASCGGGGGPPPKYSITGTISGLSGSGLAVTNEGTPVSVSGNGPFTIASAVPAGTPYNLAITVQPTGPTQTCIVKNGAGTVPSANIANVAITCSTTTYTIGGTISGLTGTGVVLSNANDTITINSNGTFSFPSAVPSGSSYQVSITNQPIGATPQQYCSFWEGSATGIVTDTAVSTVSIICANVGRFAYITNSSNGNIVGYSIDPTSGALTALSGGSLTTGSAPASLAITPNGQFAYVVNGGDNTISAYSISTTTGALTPIAGSPFTASSATSKQSVITIHPSGQFAYISNGSLADGVGPYSIDVYAINQTSGTLTALPGESLSAGSTVLSFEPTGKFAYSISIDDGDIEMYAVNTDTGALSSPTSIATPLSVTPDYLAIAPSGKFLYITGPDSLLAGYTIDSTSGALSAAIGSPYPDSGDPEEIQSLALDPGGNFAYLSNCNCRIGNTFPGSFWGFRLDGTTGIATFGAQFSADIYPGRLTFDPSGKFAYAGNAVSNDLSEYLVDASSGALTAVPGSPYSLGAQSLSESVISIAIIK